MRFKVKMKKNTREFDEVVIADNKQHAINLALKNNPETEALNVKWTYKV